MCGRLPDGAHLVEPHLRPTLRGLPCGLNPREPTADNDNFFHKNSDM
jgi:hypothetical protein